MSELKVYEHTFHDTGAVVKYHKVGPWFGISLRAGLQHTRPTPPVITVQEPGPAFGSTEEILDDPKYIVAVRKWEIELANKVAAAQIKHGVIDIVEPADWKTHVASFRKMMKAAGAKLEDEDDIFIFISQFACGTPEDLDEFSKALTQRSMPTVEAIAAARDSFQPTVEG